MQPELEESNHKKRKPEYTEAANDLAEFDIYVSKADFKFNCAHFIAHRGFRERLHGHNYRISVKVTSSSGAYLEEDGYFIDFGDIKSATRDICKSLNEYFICPMKSEAMQILETESNICLTCEDGAKFVFPKGDCAMLPLYHSSAEEIAHYLYCELIRWPMLPYPRLVNRVSHHCLTDRKLGLEKFLERKVKSMEVTVAEAPLQQAVFRCPIPQDEESMVQLEKSRVRKPSSCFAEYQPSDIPIE